MAPTGTAPGQTDHDGMIDRRQIAFLDVVAGAGLADAAGEIDAKPVHDVAGPAAAVALHFQRLFGGQNAASAPGVGVQQEIPFFAEQAEAVADLPGNLQAAIGAPSALPPVTRGERSQHAGKQRDRHHRAMRKFRPWRV